MELFSERYSCYYQVLRHLLLHQDALSIQDIRAQISKEGFEESMLSIIPKLESGEWNLFERDGALYLSKISPSFVTPLSDLEKSVIRPPHRSFSRPRTDQFPAAHACFRYAALDAGTILLL